MTASSQSQSPVMVPVELDADLLTAFNAGVPTLALLAQAVRLLTRIADRLDAQTPPPAAAKPIPQAPTVAAAVAQAAAMPVSLDPPDNPGGAGA